MEHLRGLEDMLEQGREVRQCIQGQLFEKQDKKAHLERELDELRADPTALRGLPHTKGARLGGFCRMSRGEAKDELFACSVPLHAGQN